MKSEILLEFSMPESIWKKLQKPLMYNTLKLVFFQFKFSALGHFKEISVPENNASLEKIFLLIFYLSEKRKKYFWEFLFAKLNFSKSAGCTFEGFKFSFYVFG